MVTPSGYKRYGRITRGLPRKRFLSQGRKTRHGIIWEPKLSNNMITYCPITTTAITNAWSIFGKDLVSVRGKTVRWAPAPVVGNYVAVPKGSYKEIKQ
jgi:hypothetical protein